MAKQCLKSSTKDELIELVDNIEDKKKSNKLLKLLDDIKECGKRKKSKYQKFLSTCMTGCKNCSERLKSCAKKWKAQKK